MHTITLNGQRREITPGTTAESLVGELGIGARKFAVEINREVVPKERLAETVLAAGDEVNVVTLVGGG